MLVSTNLPRRQHYHRAMHLRRAAVFLARQSRNMQGNAHFLTPRQFSPFQGGPKFLSPGRDEHHLLG